jgi:hypothetical protein
LSPEQVNIENDPSIKINEKVDIYSLGLILLELSCNIKTAHEKLSSFVTVKEKKLLPKGYGLEDSLEGRLIQMMT